MKKGTAKKSLSKGKKATSSKAKKAATTRTGKSAAASSKKKSAAAKTAKSAAPAKKTAKKAKTTAPKSSKPAASNGPLVDKNPQSKQQAALQHGMFLHTDDAWSQAYFNSNDLHSVERQLFG